MLSILLSYYVTTLNPDDSVGQIQALMNASSSSTKKAWIVEPSFIIVDEKDRDKLKNPEANTTEILTDILSKNGYLFEETRTTKIAYQSFSNGSFPVMSQGKLRYINRNLSKVLLGFKESKKKYKIHNGIVTFPEAVGLWGAIKGAVSDGKDRIEINMADLNEQGRQSVVSYALTSYFGREIVCIDDFSESSSFNDSENCGIIDTKINTVDKILTLNYKKDTISRYFPISNFVFVGFEKYVSRIPEFNSNRSGDLNGWKKTFFLKPKSISELFTDSEKVSVEKELKEDVVFTSGLNNDVNDSDLAYSIAKIYGYSVNKSENKIFVEFRKARPAMDAVSVSREVSRILPANVLRFMDAFTKNDKTYDAILQNKTKLDVYIDEKKREQSKEINLLYRKSDEKYRMFSELPEELKIRIDNLMFMNNYNVIYKLLYVPLPTFSSYPPTGKMMIHRSGRTEKWERFQVDVQGENSGGFVFSMQEPVGAK